MTIIHIGDRISLIPFKGNLRKKGLVNQFFFTIIGVIIVQICYWYSLITYLLYNNITPLGFISSFLVIIIISFFSYIFIMYFGWFAIPLLFFNKIHYDSECIRIPWYKGIIKIETIMAPIDEVKIFRYKKGDYKKLKKYNNFRLIYLFIPFILGFDTYFEKCIILSYKKNIYYYPKKCLSSNYKTLLLLHN